MYFFFLQTREFWLHLGSFSKNRVYFSFLAMLNGNRWCFKVAIYVPIRKYKYGFVIICIEGGGGCQSWKKFIFSKKLRKILSTDIFYYCVNNSRKYKDSLFFQTRFYIKDFSWVQYQILISYDKKFWNGLIAKMPFEKHCHQKITFCGVIAEKVYLWHTNSSVTLKD